MIEWIKEQLGLIEPKTLIKDTLFCGKDGGKYNEKYFFVLQTDEGVLILDRTNLKVMDEYIYAIQSINYTGMDFMKFHESREVLNGADLVETMKGLDNGSNKRD